MTPAMQRLSAGPVAGRLAGKVALVSGAGGGQGRAVALLFAEAGAEVFASDINADGLEQTRELAADGGFPLEVSTADVSDEDEVQRWITLAAQRRGGIDVLYNNAAHTHFAAFPEMTSHQWRETLRLELDVVFLPTRAAWPHMIRRGGGSVINVASLSGTRGIAYLGAAGHAAGKAGVLGLTRQLALEGAPHWIRVNAISPGPIVTPVTEALLASSPEFAHGFTGTSVLARTGRPIDVAYAGLFLASDEASYVTGADLPVDGGGASKASHTDH